MARQHRARPTQAHHITLDNKPFKPFPLSDSTRLAIQTAFRMADGSSRSTGPLFADVLFTIIPGPNLTDDHHAQLIVQLADNGAQYIPLRETDQSIDRINDITHIVSTHVDFPQYNKCMEQGIYVVKPSWVKDCVSKKKHTSERQHSPDPSQYFQDVILAWAEIPDGDAEAIQAGVIALGGQPSRGMTKLVTHLVTTSLDHPKCQVARERAPQCKIILPHWFDACVKLGKKINEKPYLLPDPEILRRDNTAVRPSPTPQLEGATTASPRGEPVLPSPPPSPSQSRKMLAAFPAKSIYLAKDLELSDRLRNTLEELIVSGGGKVVDNVDICDIYIGYFRDGDGYVKASRDGKEVANLAWLYHVINRNTYTSPLRKLLHYPIPRKGLPGFENMRISLTNYSGEARIYVENLIRYAGAEYTKTMKQDNTHLITAHMSGDKCEAAQEWNITIINHLWLEESYAKCAIQAPSNPKYNHFPPRTNLGEVTGHVCLDMKGVERMFFPKPKSPQKSKQVNKITSRSGVPASSAMPTGAPIDGMDMDLPTVVIEEEMEVEPEAEPKTTRKKPGRPRKSDAEKSMTPRIRLEEKENKSPSVGSTGRASKARALSNLHTQAEDIALYEKEVKRKGGVIYGGRRESRADEASSPMPVSRNSRKRPSDEYNATAQDSDLSDGETQGLSVKQNKKAKTSSTSSTLPPIKYKMMVTGDDRWSGNSKKESADKTTLRQLGVSLTQDPKEVDILVAPKILRTKKFVCALAGAPLIVDSKFLDTALSKKKLTGNPAMLKDREGEERLGFRLADSLERAKSNKRQLFRGWTIYVTKEVKGGFDTYKDIVGLNGGTALLYTGRTGTILAKRDVRNSPNQGGDDELDKIYLVTGDGDADAKVWKPFRTMANKQGLEARIVTPDWLLNAALRQEVVFEQKWLRLEETT
jgi:hypothetical protein